MAIVKMNEISLDSKLNTEELVPIMQKSGYEPFSLTRKVLYVIFGKNETTPPPDFIRKGKTYGRILVDEVDQKTRIFISTEQRTDIEEICLALKPYGAKLRYA